MDSGSGSGAGWHPDPFGRHQFRWFDGSAWSDQVSNWGSVTTDPLGVAPGAPQAPAAPVASAAPGAGSAPPALPPPFPATEPGLNPRKPRRMPLIVAAGVVVIALVAATAFWFFTRPGSDDSVGSSKRKYCDQWTAIIANDVRVDDYLRDDVSGPNARTLAAVAPSAATQRSLAEFEVAFSGGKSNAQRTRAVRDVIDASHAVCGGPTVQDYVARGTDTVPGDPPQRTLVTACRVERRTLETALAAFRLVQPSGAASASIEDLRDAGILTVRDTRWLTVADGDVISKPGVTVPHGCAN